ncbi:hypothetical protein [Nocardia jejuensis]|uniref:hypothetical protein n=1 Tax=Nocardia jejuensis TaxID=328049 RepID=UPI000830FFC0|nr:hypothetical protein [Nocardia jejuensis]
MPSATTQAAARAHLLRHFTQTLRALPAEFALTLHHPDLPAANLHRGVNLPWEQNNPDNLLEFFDIRYWVVGTTPDTSDEYFDLVTKAWTEQSWPTRTDRPARPRTTYTRTPDGYGLTLTQSINGYLSLAGSTPAFAPDSPEGEPVPTRIDRPAE